MKINRLRGRCKHGSGFFIAMLMAGTAYDAHALLDHQMTYMEEMGKRLFHEKTLSLNEDQACSTCHTGDTGGTHGDPEVNRLIVGAPGSKVGKFGTLRPPTNQYVQFFDDEGELKGVKNFEDKCSDPGPRTPCGGAFWNGRAEGGLIDPEMVFEGLEEEYKVMYKDYMGALTDKTHASPWLNILEQALPSKQAVCDRVKETKWGKELYKYAWGTELRCDDEHIDREFARFAMSTGAWQMSKDNNSFKSNRDIFLMRDYDGKFPLDHYSEEENHGHDLFFGAARCFFCHQSENNGGVGKFETYTSGRYFNIGLARNHQITDDPEPDHGVSKTLDEAYPGDESYNNRQKGKHKVPTLRNVDKRPYPGFTKSYMHNGWLKNLKDVVHFYNTSSVPNDLSECDVIADFDDPQRGEPPIHTACKMGKTRCEEGGWTAEQAIEANCWPEPEIEENRSTGFALGNLHLSDYDEAAIVAYLKTLSDREDVRYPRPYISRRYDKRRLSH